MPIRIPTALLGRVELRDLQDVEALMGAGADLAAALREAPRKDGGFSAMTLAWVLRPFDVPSLARAVGWAETRVSQLETFRLELIDLLTHASRPE